MSEVHATALVHPKAELGERVSIGPYAVVHEGVRVGDGCEIGAFSVLHSGVSLGRDNQLSEHVVLGGPPQDVNFDPAIPSGVEIGDANRFREFCTVHRSAQEKQATRIASGCMFMFGSHVAHDCEIEAQVVLAGHSALAGHVRVGERAFISGHVMVQQHVRIGRISMIAGLVPVNRDVLPFALLGRDPVAHYSLNRVGLKRAGIEGERYRELEGAWRALREGVSAAELPGDSEEVRHLKEWLQEPDAETWRGHCGFLRPKQRRGSV